MMSSCFIRGDIILKRRIYRPFIIRIFNGKGILSFDAINHQIERAYHARDRRYEYRMILTYLRLPPIA